MSRLTPLLLAATLLGASLYASGYAPAQALAQVGFDEADAELGWFKGYRLSLAFDNGFHYYCSADFHTYHIDALRRTVTLTVDPVALPYWATEAKELQLEQALETTIFEVVEGAWLSTNRRTIVIAALFAEPNGGNLKIPLRLLLTNPRQSDATLSIELGGKRGLTTVRCLHGGRLPTRLDPANSWLTPVEGATLACSADLWHYLFNLESSKPRVWVRRPFSYPILSEPQAEELQEVSLAATDEFSLSAVHQSRPHDLATDLDHSFSNFRTLSWLSSALELTVAFSYPSSETEGPIRHHQLLCRDLKSIPNDITELWNEFYERIL